MCSRVVTNDVEHRAHDHTKRVSVCACAQELPHEEPGQVSAVGIDSVEEVEEALEETLAEVPVIEELVEETLADVEDLEINENADVVVELETDAGDTVEIPDEADEPIVLESAEGEVLEVELPGNGDDAEVLDDGSVIYEDAVTDTDIVVQAQEDGGVRMITVIDGPDAPAQFPFEVSITPSTVIMAGDDGTVGIVDIETNSVEVLPVRSRLWSSASARSVRCCQDGQITIDRTDNETIRADATQVDDARRRLDTTAAARKQCR